MALSRRDALRLALFGTVASSMGAPPVLARAVALGGYGLDATHLGLTPNSSDDQSRALSAALIESAKRQQPLILPPGRYRIGGVALPEGARIMGVPGATQLVSALPGPILTARKVKRLGLSGLMLDGLLLRQNERTGLMTLEDVTHASLDEMHFINAGAIGLTLTRSGGRIERSHFALMKDAALFSMDAHGLAVEGNTVEECGNNGIQIWRSSSGDDGTLLRGNRISRIRNDLGGTGQYGNGISVFRAGGMIVSGNVIRDCAYSFIRNNGGSGVQISDNNLQRCGETGIFVEFSFEGAVVANNRLEDVASGISITNLDQGGRLAVCSGNLVRRAKRGLTPRTGEVAGGTGIHVEAESTVTGNVVESAQLIGISLGWGVAMRNLVATGNMILDTDVGVSVSLASKERNIVVASNVIAKARKGAVVGTEYGKAVTGDLTKATDPRASGVRVEGNAVG